MTGPRVPLAALREHLGNRIAGLAVIRDREVHATAAGRDMPEVADTLQARFGAELLLMAAEDRRANAGCFFVHYLFDHKRDDWFVHVTAEVAADEPSLVSLARQNYPASRFEREIRTSSESRPPAIRIPGRWSGTVLAGKATFHCAGTPGLRRSRTTASRSRSDRSKGRVYTRSRSVPCTRASSNPATSDSAPSVRRSST